ncbi:MAG: PorV/PorQ family protein [Bacteroidota bacterium]
MAQTKIGTTAAQFLKIGVGPRAIAMGGAYVASNRDVTSLYWNVGAFQQAEKSELLFSHTDWLVDTKFQWVGFMLHLGDENAIGVSLTQLDYGEEQVTTVELPEGTSERWAAKDLSLGISYSRRLTDRFSMGATVKYIEQRIWNESATTFAFDLGLLFVTGFNDMRLGVSMTNFGGDLRMDGSDLTKRVDVDPQNAGSNKALVANMKTDPWALPLAFRVGLAMDVVKTESLLLTLAADAIRPNDNDSFVNLGGEVGWRSSARTHYYGLFLRGGYKSVVGIDTEEGLSFGGGLTYTAGGIGSIQVDYAYTQFGLFGNLNTIAVSIGW